MKTKVLAMYLPQYHQILENDMFWGKGFTDWDTVKAVKPLFSGHNQPRIPLNDNYYDLSKKETVEWQVRLANKYGIHGFGIYHYWFNNQKNILTRPAEIIYENKEININYFFAWDNISWKRSWSNVSGNDWSPVSDKKIENKDKNNSGILIPFVLGDEKSWHKHFTWLLPYFRDERYIKVEGKPLFVIFHCRDEILRMCEFWNKLAIDNHLKGIHVVFRKDYTKTTTKGHPVFQYEPSASSWDTLQVRLYRRFLKLLGIDYGPKFFDYDNVWKKLLHSMSSHPEMDFIPSAFVGYDDTPRRGKRGTIIKGQDPVKFKKYMQQLLDITSRQGKPFLFLTAWNEWSEGAYLEPDEKEAYSYLNALKEILNEK